MDEDTAPDEKPTEPDPAFPEEPQESVRFQPITPAPAKPNVEPHDEG